LETGDTAAFKAAAPLRALLEPFPGVVPEPVSLGFSWDPHPLL